MNASPTISLSGDRLACGCGAMRSLCTLVGRELRDALLARWFLLYTLAFAGLGLGVSHASAATAGGGGLAGFGRTSAGLVNLVLLVVPLMSLTAGAGAIAGDRERGTLSYLLAMPVTRFEVLLAKFVAMAVALACAVLLGFGACAAALAWGGSSVHAGNLLGLVGVTLLLSTSMLSVGLLISALARRTSVAIGAAVFAWLFLVFVSDLGLMAGTLTLKLPIETLFGLSLANPMQVFKMASLRAVDASLDVLGPAGLYGQQRLGAARDTVFAAILLAWTLVPLALATVVFNRRSPL